MRNLGKDIELINNQKYGECNHEFLMEQSR